MSALRKIEMIETAAPKRTARLAEVISIVPPVEEMKMSVTKRVALFLASPFVGLAYIAAMPIVATAMLLWFAAKALVAKIPAGVKKASMIVVAPVLGLGFIVALPLLGISALGYYALKSIGEKA